jgi:hypothetical protein
MAVMHVFSVLLNGSSSLHDFLKIETKRRIGKLNVSEWYLLLHIVVYPAISSV